MENTAFTSKVYPNVHNFAKYVTINPVKDSSKPFFSIIIPAYNTARYIDTCLESILNQTYTSFEVIIVDDASTDSTEEKIKKYSDPRIHFLKHTTNKGPGAARNTAIMHSSGVWLVCVDSDDWLTKDRLQEIHDYVQKNIVDIVADDNYLVKNESDIPKETLFSKLGITVFHKPISLSYQLTYTPAIHPCIRKEFLQKNNLTFSEETSGCEDYGLWARSILYGARIHYIKKPLYFYRQRIDSLTKDKEKVFNSLITNTQIAIMVTNNPNYKDLLQKKLNETHHKKKIYQLWQSIIVDKKIFSALVLVRYSPFILIFFVKKILREYI